MLTSVENSASCARPKVYIIKSPVKGLGFQIKPIDHQLRFTKFCQDELAYWSAHFNTKFCQDEFAYWSTDFS